MPRAGLIAQVPVRIRTARTAGTAASGLPEAASAPTPAQVIDASASAIVAIREEVCRRRNWSSRLSTQCDSFL
jgi:hypothetical protein